jgi:DNA topoisomerase VI subunit B
VRPTILVTVEPDAFSVQDNGPGLPAEVLARSLDYTVRVSDKAYYVSPTRGQLGNALKCVWAASFLAGGECGRVEVDARGERHLVEVTLDRIAQQPCLRHSREPGVGKNGTIVRIHWPGIASCPGVWGENTFYNATALLSSYSTFNPHATFTLGEQTFAATAPSWQKWTPSRPTSPHWYGAEQFQALIAAYLTAERAGARARTVREFVSEFHGLSGTAKQKAVVAEARLSGAWLGELASDAGVDARAAARLLNAMRAAARPVNPTVLGVLGERHLAHSLLDYGADPDSVRYHCVKGGGEAGCLPFVLEAALGVGQDEGATAVAGVNWSPTLRSPFHDLDGLLGEMRIDPHDPVTVVVHLAYPCPGFTDRGKCQMALPSGVRAALERCVRSVAKSWKEAKRQADRRDRVSEQQLERLRKARRAKVVKIKDAAYGVMEAAYLHAAGGPGRPANARQIMYAARPRVLELTDGRCWKQSSYFTQHLLPDFVDAHPDLTAGWDVIYDARGRLIEPHTRRRVDLGTLQVRQYIADWTGTVPARPAWPGVLCSCPTVGPAWRYNFALFVEKEGFDRHLEQAEVAGRFDVAIMSTKGMSVTAARRLVDELSGKGVTVLVLRDLDKAGFSIVHTLGTDGRRYQFRHKPRVIDLGLRLQDVRAMGLLSEPVSYASGKDPRENLRECGATADECAFLVGRQTAGGWAGERVELNAMTTAQFTAFVERKLAEAGVKKVVPRGEDLRRAYRRAEALAAIQEAIDRARSEVGTEKPRPVPRDLGARIAGVIEGTGKSWDQALWEILCEQRGGGPAR